MSKLYYRYRAKRQLKHHSASYSRNTSTHDSHNKQVYQRCITVSKNGYTARTSSKYPEHCRREAIPIIKLHGLWLKKAGFMVNMQVKVRISKARILLTVIDNTENNS